MRMRKKKWALPELQASPMYVAQPDDFKGAWRTLFAHDAPLHVELGCGKGVSTAAMAFDNQNINYVAIDVNSDVLGVARRNITAAYGNAAADNIRIALKKCEFISQTFAAEDRVERIYLNFCNPWDRRDRHAKRRLTHPRQLMQYRQFLVDGGEIWFKTDDDELFDDSMGYFRMCGFTLKYYTRDLHASGFAPNYVSEHEAMFTQQGLPTHFLIAVKDHAPADFDFTSRNVPVPERTTCCYIQRGGQTLMLLRNKKEHDGNAGKWLGIGGHFEDGETPAQCVTREALEETGLRLINPVLRGVVLFISGDWTEHMYVYAADQFEGELNPNCNEGELHWIDNDKISMLNMWQGDRLFLKLIAQGHSGFDLELIYGGDEQLIEARMNGQPVPLA